MYKITVKYPLSQAEIATEKLCLVGIYNVFYESPLTITTNDYGYGYYENEDELMDFNIIVEDDSIQELERHCNLVKYLLDIDVLDVSEVSCDIEEVQFETIDLNNGWVLADPSLSFENKNKINFIPQGAFGTGLHETTQDCLRFILDKDFSNLKVLDIGTGSGILSLAAAVKNAKKVTALDIRDVTAEINLNASLNNLDNIEVKVGNALSEELQMDTDYDFVIINIGGEETDMFMDFIKNHLSPKGQFLVSGLVEWSFDKVVKNIEKYNFKQVDKKQSNEWCTALFKQI